MSDVVKLTPNAVEHMNSMLKEHKKSIVRLSLKGGGCAGFKYDWTLDDSKDFDDEVIKLDNGEFAMDSASIMYLIGSTIDYKKEVFGSYFTIENPASTSSCGCGESIGF
jgi:iron-sulfur cluster assembly accessory protein